MSWVAPYRYSALHDFKIKVPHQQPSTEDLIFTQQMAACIKFWIFQVLNLSLLGGALADGEALPALAASLVSAQVLYSVRHPWP